MDTTALDTPATETTAQRTLVREATRNAWDTIHATGHTPSVRKVYNIVGGTHSRVVDECRQLRAESGEPADLQEVCDDPPQSAADPLDPRCDVAAEQAGVFKAEAAFHAEQAQFERLTEALAQAEQAFAQADEAAGIGLSRQILAGVVPTEVQEHARQARAQAYLERGDLQDLLHEQEDRVAQAAAALSEARRRVKTAEFNMHQEGGPALLDQLNAAADQLKAAIAAVLAHDVQRLRLGVELGIGDVLAATPFAARVTEPSLPLPVNSTNFGVLNLWVYDQLAQSLPMPVVDAHARGRICHLTLEDITAAFSVLLDLDADMRLGGDRRFPTSLRANPSPEAHNAVPLSVAGLPGMLSTYGPVALTREQFQALHASAPGWIMEGS